MNEEITYMDSRKKVLEDFNKLLKEGRIDQLETLMQKEFKASVSNVKNDLVIKIIIPFDKHPILFENLSFKLIIAGKEYSLKILEKELEEKFDDGQDFFKTQIKINLGRSIDEEQLQDIESKLNTKITNIITARYVKMIEEARDIVHKLWQLDSQSIIQKQSIGR